MNTGILRGLAKALSDYTLTTGWIPVTADWRFIAVDGSITTIEARGQLTNMGNGDRIKATNNGATKTGIIVKKDAYQASTPGRTRFYVYTGTGTAFVAGLIRDPWYSHEYAPVGFDPDPAKWSQSFTSTSAALQATPTNGTVYNPGSQSIDVPIGSWDAAFECGIRALTTAPVGPALLTITSFVALSTSASAISDSTGQNIHVHSQGQITLQGYSNSTVIEGRLPARRSFRCTMIAKTTLFLDALTTTNGAASIGYDGGNTETRVVLTCAYL